MQNNEKICFNKAYIISFSKFGKSIADKIFNILQQEEICKPENIIESQKSKFEISEPFSETEITTESKKKNLVIFIGALGICVRKISPYLQNKTKDPAVLCIDDRAAFVIPVLSGHIGGANQAAQFFAQKLNATPVITTSTDINKKWAFDVWCKKHNYDIAKIGNESQISTFIQKINSKSLNEEPFFTVGIGCKKNTEIAKFEDFVINFCDENEIPIKLIKSISSIDVKKNEQCIIQLSKKYDTLINFYTTTELNSIKTSFPAIEFSKSSFVKATVGVDCVCEQAAICACPGINPQLILKKHAKNGMTIAVALDA